MSFKFKNNIVRVKKLLKFKLVGVAEVGGNPDYSLFYQNIQYCMTVCGYAVSLT